MLCESAQETYARCPLRRVTQPSKMNSSDRSNCFSNRAIKASVPRARPRMALCGRQRTRLVVWRRHISQPGLAGPSRARQTLQVDRVRPRPRLAVPVGLSLPAALGCASRRGHSPTPVPLRDESLPAALGCASRRGHSPPPVPLRDELVMQLHFSLPPRSTHARSGPLRLAIQPRDAEGSLICGLVFALGAANKIAVILLEDDTTAPETPRCPSGGNHAAAPLRGRAVDGDCGR
jgi:hypothetical protein